MAEGGTSKAEWEIVAHRWNQWKTYSKAPICSICRARNVHRQADLPDIRVTPVGDVCLSCWLDRESCEVCGVGAVAIGWSTDSALEFRHKKVCADCLVPNIPRNAWRDWLLYYVYTPRSSFAEILEDVLAEAANPQKTAPNTLPTAAPVLPWTLGSVAPPPPQGVPA